MATVAATAVLGVVIALIFWALHKWMKQIRQQKGINSPGLPLPVFGHSLHFVGVDPCDILEVFQSFFEKKEEKRKMLFHFGPNTVLWGYHPETVEPLFNNSAELLGKSVQYDCLMRWLGTGLLTSTGKKWHSRRKMLTPAFHFQILDDALSTFNSKADVLCDILSEDFSKEGTSHDLFPYVQRCALDIILETSMGFEMDIQNKRHTPYATAIANIVHIFQLRQFIPWYMPDILFDWFSKYRNEHEDNLRVLHGFTESVITSRRQQMLDDLDELKTSAEGAKKRKLAFLDLLLKFQLSGGETSLTDRDIREEVDTFMFEGHDTTTCSLAWTLFLIGHHPEVQEKLYKEQIEIFGENGYSDNVEKTHLTKMKYLEACIKESLRLYPSVPIIARKVEKDFYVDGFTISKGQTYGVFIHYLHRNPDVWDNPNQFIPERFVEGSSIGLKKRHPYAYVPFSAGARNCIGQKFAQMEELTVLSKVLRKYRVESLEKIEDVKPVVEIITRPHCGIKAKLHLR